MNRELNEDMKEIVQKAVRAAMALGESRDAEITDVFVAATSAFVEGITIILAQSYVMSSGSPEVVAMTNKMVDSIHEELKDRVAKFTTDMRIKTLREFASAMSGRQTPPSPV